MYKFDHENHEINNPINTQSFQHFLNFKSLGFEELYQITEPSGFDVANFVIQQNEERFGRDIVFGNDTQNLIFYVDAVGEKISTVQSIDDSGRKSFYLNNGFFFIKKTLDQFGFEGEIEYILKKDGLQFTIGILDLANVDSDFLTYIGCNVIQNTSISNYKKQIDSSIDVFSTKNIKGNPITPAPTLKFLRKAVPIYARSKWNSQNAWEGVNLDSVGQEKTVTYFYNICNNIVSSDIKNSGSSAQEQYTENDDDYPGYYPGSNFEYVKTKFGLTNVEIKIRNFSFSQVNDVDNGGDGYVRTEFIMRWGYNIDNPLGSVSFFDYLIDEGETFYLNSNLDHTIPFLPAGASVWLFFKSKVRQSATQTAGTPRFESFTSISKYDITIEAMSTALDTVISGVRYIDMIKQCSKFINNLPIDAEIFDVGGKYYDNICYGRSLLSPNTANSIKLISNTFPKGSQIGEIVKNTDSNFLDLGLYFWNGLQWIFYTEKDAHRITLINNTTPSGLSVNEVIYNLDSNGLFFWTGSTWFPMQILRPFVTSITDCYESAMTIETCSDHEIQQNKIFFGEYADFYKDEEIGRFKIIPSKDYKVRWNERFKINNFKLGYETFETNRLSKDTANDIHTESEWSIPNEYVENKWERSINYIRSGYSAQAMVDIETNTPATADENDDDVYINDIFPLPEGTICKFTANLQMIIVDGKVQVLNRNSSTDENDVIINWQTRGFSVGDSFRINSGENTGNYTIFEFTNTTLTLTPVGFSPTFSGDSVIEIIYTYVNVFWQTKADEGFEYVNNLLNSNRYPNLNFSIKRNILRWSIYLKTAINYHQDKPIRKLFFKNNPLLVSKKTGENEVKEIADYIIEDSPILSPKIIDLETYAIFSDVLAMLEKYGNNQRGFITCVDEIGNEIKGFPQEIDYLWKSGILRLKLEEKFNSLI